MIKAPNHYDIAIIGDGIVGSSLACALDDVGFRVALVSADAWGCAEDCPDDLAGLRVSALSGSSCHLLQRVGIWPELASTGQLKPYRGVQVWDSCSTQDLTFQATELHRDELGFIVADRCVTLALHRQLAQRSSIICYTGVSLQDLSMFRLGCGRELNLDDGTRLTASLVVGADGAHSNSRFLAGFALQTWDHSYCMINAQVQLAQSHQDTVWQCFTATGSLLLLPLPVTAGQNRCVLIWLVQPAQAVSLMALDADDFCQALGQVVACRLGSVLAVDSRLCAPLRQQHVKSYVRPAMALLSDAAYIMHPLLAQGTNLGLLDVVALTEILGYAYRRGADFSSLPVLQRYQRRRQRDNLHLMALTAVLSRLHGTQNIRSYCWRNLSLGTLRQLPSVKCALMQRVIDLGLALPPLTLPNSF
jgi:2-octaprenylphenol hydroxylase